MDRILGVDWDTRRLAWAIYDGRRFIKVEEKILKASMPVDDRFYELMYIFEEVLETTKSDILFIEDATYVRNKKGFLKLGPVLGGLRATALAFGIESSDIRLVAGSVWKKNIGLSGNANKKAVAEWVHKFGPQDQEGWSQDMKDAFVIGLYGSSNR